MKETLACLALCLLAASPDAHADDPAFNLPIGDPARREKHASVVLDGVTDTATGEVLTPAEMAARLKDVGLLFVGESHTSVEFHNVQLATIKALKQAGRKVMVGLEMYPYTEQTWLDRWNAGELTEASFLKESRWYKNWGYHWNYYRDIFQFARENGITLHAVNTPRAVISAVRKKGFANLTEEEAAHIPPKVDTDSADHKRLFRAYFTGEDTMHAQMSEEMWDAMYRAQATWDATMGYNAVQALKKAGDRNAIMVVLIGSGHVSYGLGAERQARLWYGGKTASLIPVPVVGDKGEKPAVRASYANFLWGVAHEEDALYPSLGLSTPEEKTGEHFPVINVQKDSVAEAAGFKKGDLIVSLDGTRITDKETSNRLMSEKRWGDSAEYVVKRGDETLTLVAKFRRRPRSEDPPPAVR